MNRFDIHVNLGSFPGSKKGKQQRFVSPKEMAEYFQRNEITHSLVLYNRDEYELLRELISLSETKVYGVQCIFGPDKDRPTDMKTLLDLDVNNPERSFVNGGGCYGVKVASCRGWWLRDGEVDSGIKYTDKYIKKVLKSLPRNSIASFHTQGTVSPSNTASPLQLSQLAKNFPHVKFIVNHGGDYGPPLRCAKPSEQKIRDLDKKALNNLTIWANHKALIRSGYELTEHIFNMFNDMSCWTQEKGYLGQEYTQWCIGSDFPFVQNFCEYKPERERFLKWCNYIPDDEAVRFFEEDMEVLMEDTLKRHELLKQTYKKRTDERREERKNQ